MNELIIQKTNGGLGRRLATDDGISGLLVQGVAVTGGVQLNTAYRLASLDDARALGITPAYDTTNNVLVYEHIKEYFRLQPDGDLFLMLAATSASINDMLSPGSGSVYALATGGEGKIKQMAVAFNPDTPLAAGAVTATVGTAQSFADWAAQTHKPLVVLLEGWGVDMNDADLHGKNAPSVSVVVGQNLAVANAGHANYAAVGTVLGAVSKARVNESVGWVEKFNLTGDNLQTPGLFGQPLSDYTDGQISQLDDRAYLFFITYTGLAGIYLNDSYTATVLTDDYAYIEANRTINKAIRLVRSALLPKLAAPVKVDTKTGRLSPEVIKQFELTGKRALEVMSAADEISDMEMFVDPLQDIIGSSELKIQFSIIPTGTARKISVTIGFKNPTL